MSAEAQLEQRIEAAFRAVERERMQDVPILNPALRVEAVGFRRRGEEWLGVLITPWFINVMLLPAAAGAQSWTPGVGVEVGFPAGTCSFIGAHLPALGDYGACSLFSPVLEVEDQRAARLIALAALAALLRPDAADLAAAAEACPAASGEAQMPRRAFLTRALPPR